MNPLISKEKPMLNRTRISVGLPVGNNQDNKDEDVRTVRTALEYLDHLKDDGIEKDYTGKPLGIITARLENGIRDFQGKSDLKVDGKINPSGETITKINQKIAEKTKVEVKPKEGRRRRSLQRYSSRARK
jgi:peptidoglycan hydrolase-like protein with peptidoglycan-binding domain